MRFALALVLASGLLVEAVPSPFQHLATTDDGGLLYLSAAGEIFVYDGPSLRSFARQDAGGVVSMTVSGDGRVVAYNIRSDEGFQANLASPSGSVFWTTIGQAAISRNGRYALFVPGDGTVTITDLRDGTGFTVPAASPLSLPLARAISSDGTAVLPGEREVRIVAAGSSQPYSCADHPNSAVIDDAAATVAYDTQDSVTIMDLAGGTPTVLDGSRPALTNDGQLLLYLGPDSQAWIVARDGSGARQLTSIDGGIVEAVISGDGSAAYALTKDNRVLRIDPASAAVRDITAAIAAAANPQPRVISFAVSPSAIGPGGAAQLCYNVANAAAISIQPGFASLAGPSGCQTVSPSVTTTYTLSASGSGSQATASATLAVAGNVQIASFTNDPAFSSAAGSAVTLSWTTLNAVSIAITGNGVPSGTLPLNGSIVVNPVTNTSYTLIAYGTNGQSVSAVLYVFVR